MYYADKLESIGDLFGSRKIVLENDRLVVDSHAYPILDDVIILLEPSQYPPSLAKRLNAKKHEVGTCVSNFAEDIQFTFGQEWQRFPNILPEHKQEFSHY